VEHFRVILTGKYLSTRRKICLSVSFFHHESHMVWPGIELVQFNMEGQFDGSYL